MIDYLHSGHWPLGRVIIDRVPTTRRIDPAVEASIDAAWVAAMARPGVHLFDGPMCRLESAAVVGYTLRLSVSEVSYKTFLGTNMADTDVDHDVAANPIGVSAAVRTADGFLLLGRRNDAVAYYPGRIHPFAGCLESTDPDVFAAVYRELGEELHVDRVEKIVCLGMIQDQALRQPELVFVATVAGTADQIELALDPAEHRAVVRLPADEIGRALGDPALTPVAVGLLTLFSTGPL